LPAEAGTIGSTQSASPCEERNPMSILWIILIILLVLLLLGGFGYSRR
jgi:flagellar basal body-associated protein FliL